MPAPQPSAEDALLRCAALEAELRETESRLNRVQQELNWKTAFLEAQVNSTIDGIIVVDPQGRKILQNQRAADLFQIPRHIVDDPDDTRQVQWVTDMTSQPAQFIEKVVHLYSHPDEISRDEIELKNGSVLDRYSSPVTGKDGTYYGRIWSFHDITLRKQAEKALRESEKRFAGAFEHAPIGVALASPTGRWLKVNRALCRLVGYSEEELLIRSFQDITHPEDLADSLECVRQLIAGEIRSYQSEKRYIHAAGHLVTVLLNVSLVRGAQNQPRYFIAQMQDITERKRTEESLRLLSSAVKQSKESIMITEAQLDLPGPKIIFVNPAFTQMTGYTAAEVLGLTPRLLQGPLTDRTVLDRLRHDLEQGDAFAGETINYRKDGTAFDLEWQIAPLRDASSSITHFVAIQRDITGRKRLEAQLIQSQKMETVGKLAGGVAHEFNSILTAIIGQSELLLADLPAGSPLSGKVTEINQAAGRATLLTRQLLAYGRKQILQPEVLNLNTVLASMAGTLRHLVGHKIDIRSVPAAGLQTVKADAGQIAQVIMNMVINAHDAMPAGGKLTLETANVTFDQTSVDRYPELKPGDYVMLAISDTGTGMSAAVQSRVFEPFFSTKGVGEGTGLGLSTCYGIIKQSGGHITVYSETALGTTFKIYLPQVAAAQGSTLAHSGAAPDLPRGTETILLVEDDPSLREMAGALLQRLGYTVVTAANGIEALSLRDAHLPGHIDLLFTDVVMPQMSGKELAERVLTLSPQTRTLFTSAYTENAIAHQGVLNQGVVLLQKPFTPAALAQKLRDVLDAPVTSAQQIDSGPNAGGTLS
jgi:two-component system cell cycle sensor histidine kinase/response regulator CckA